MITIPGEMTLKLRTQDLVGSRPKMGFLGKVDLKLFQVKRTACAKALRSEETWAA